MIKFRGEDSVIELLEEDLQYRPYSVRVHALIAHFLA